jgi:hypothetical protein
MKKNAVQGFLRFFLFFLSVSILFSCGSSRRTANTDDGWELLANRKVNFVRDVDEITVRNRGQFTAIRLKVEDRDVRISDLKIYFNNGDKLEPNIDDVINANQYSRVIDLSRDGRHIDRIEFKYRTTGNILKGRAHVLVYGKRYNR